MNLLPIVKGIPVVPKKPTKQSILRDTLLVMKPGDSIIVKMARNSPYATAKRHGIKITIREVEDGWLRIWRL